MQRIAIAISLQPDTGVFPIEKNGAKTKHEKSALEAPILELNIKKSKIEASILAIVTDGLSGRSTIISLGGNSQAGNTFGRREDKAQIKEK